MSLVKSLHMHIIFCLKEADTGSLLEYDHNGALVGVTRAARSPGTTLTLLNLFATMPVRQKEFQRNIKKEFARLCHVLNAYCLVRNVQNNNSDCHDFFNIGRHQLLVLVFTSCQLVFRGFVHHK